MYIGYISHAPPDLGFDDRGVRGGGGGGGGGGLCVCLRDGAAATKTMI